jgi:geranylgeranyl diphosphate synthase, type II
VRSPDELRRLIDAYLAGLPLHGELAEAVRYALQGGGKRIRPVLCLAVAEAAGAPPPMAAPAAAAVELVHTFSLVHDDLPALDDDAVRRGRPSTHVQFGEAQAILAGDALLGQAFELVTSYEPELVKPLVKQLAGATLAMIQGQHLELSGDTPDIEELYRLKTGALFTAAAACGLRVAEVPEGGARPWLVFAGEFGLLFQVVDDIIDGDGVVVRRGPDAARKLAEDVEARASAALDEIDADTAVLAELLSGLSGPPAAR